jgi:peptidoglycan/LPS O-acetylase OafA/YrhL
VPTDRPATAAPPSHAGYLAIRRFAALDGLRCLAITAVIWHHSRSGTPALPLSANGFLGVDLFFVISGFLITTLLLRERRRTGSISLKDFYARRTLRIFPPYYLVLLGLALFLGFIRVNATMRPAFFHELPWCLTYTTNWVQPTTLLAISWSLSAEEQFYLFWPPVERFAARYATWILLALLLLNQAINFRLADPLLHATFGIAHDGLRILQVTFTPILLGVLLARLLDDERSYRRLAALLPAWSAPLAALLMVAVADLPGDLSGWPRLALHLLMTLLLAACVVRERGIVPRALAWRPLAAIGAVSYGMYLLHLLALDLVMRGERFAGPQGSGVRFAACLALTYLAAAAMYHGFERPILALRSRFTR